MDKEDIISDSKNVLRPRNRNELAREYGISVRTLNRWFKRESLNIPKGIIIPRNLQIIFEKIGFPDRINRA